ncbi:hypothetical protein BUALT_Bualt01G0145700 [Buddleja alternifolia]|uniref:Sec-independent protein translocase protein TATA, chloroplastic n=1 Tax=Buddleja alternifolia TaxID=168488 RepID=A0AAV6Y785_9LAMI|nr:hypothetical protein BUALT_Bualt01G0145700 [Buddleja alternifolia]
MAATIAAVTAAAAATTKSAAASLQPTTFTCLSSSNSVFFSSRGGVGLYANRPTPRISNNNINRRGRGLSCKCLFGLGVPELVVIAGVAALVFGPKKLPEVGRSIGKTVKSFQQAAKEFESELKKEGESSSTEKITAEAASEEEKQEAKKVPSTKDIP